MKDINVLVEAKKRYIEQLQQIMTPRLYEGFESIYENSLELLENEYESKNQQTKSIARVFQEALKEIPLWNQDIIDHEFERIVKVSNCDYIEDLIEAVFIAESKILTSVQIHKNKTKMKVHVPRGSHFMHRCYINSAREIYNNPYVFNHSRELTPKEKHDNTRQIIHMINEGITSTIRSMLPIRDILKQSMINMDGGDIESDESDSDLDIEHSDDERGKKHSKNEESSESESDSESESESEIESDNQKEEIQHTSNESEFKEEESEEESESEDESESESEDEESELEEESKKEEISSENPSLISNIMDSISTAFQTEKKPLDTSFLKEDEEEDDDDDESTSREALVIDFNDELPPSGLSRQDSMIETPYSVSIEEEEDETPQIKNINLDGIKVPKDFLNKLENQREIQPVVQTHIQQPSPETYYEKESFSIEKKNETPISNETIKQQQPTFEKKIDEDNVSVASSGIIYRSEPKVNKISREEEHIMTLKKLKKREKERDMIKFKRPHRPLEGRGSLYEKSLENYKKYHSSADSMSIVSGISDISTVKKTNSVDQFLNKINQEKSQISYVQRPQPQLIQPRLTTPKIEDSGDEYESDKDLNFA